MSASRSASPKSSPVRSSISATVERNSETRASSSGSSKASARASNASGITLRTGFWSASNAIECSSEPSLHAAIFQNFIGTRLLNR